MYRSALSLLLLLAPGIAHANDASAEVAAGSIQFKKTNSISMESEDLYLSENKVRIKYEFKNNGKTDYRTIVAFPLPTYYIGFTPSDNANESFAYRVKKTFSVISNGTPVQPKTEIKASRDGYKGAGPSTGKVTQLLIKHGIPLEGDEDTTKAIKTLNPSAAKELLDANLITEEKKSEWIDTGSIQANGSTYVEKITKSIYEPAWYVTKKYYWDQTFAASKMTTLEHEYAPRVGSAYSFGGEPFSEDTINSYCIDKATQSALKRRIKPEEQIGYSTLAYILTTANTWSGPIKNFVLTVEKANPNDLVSFCMNGADVKKTGPKTFQVHLKNFTPTRELKILFIHLP